MKKLLSSLLCCVLTAFNLQAQTWTKVTDASTLNVGDKVVIVANNYNYALSTEQKSNNRGQVFIEKNGDNVLWAETGPVQELTLEAGTKSNTFAFYTGSGYLYAASSSDNYLRTKTTKDANGSWAISIDGNGVATIKAQGSYTRNVMQYNQSSSLFACYSSASQKAISLYKYTAAQVSEVKLPTVSVQNNSTIRVGDKIVITPAYDNIVSYKINSGSNTVIRNGEATTITAEAAGNMTLAITTVCNSNSQQLSTTYTYHVKPGTPVISVPDDITEFESTLLVSISSNEGTIRYTTDDTSPTSTSGEEYTAPFEISATTTIKAIAVVDGIISDEVCAIYTKIDPNALKKTLSFSNIAQRTYHSETQQIWEQDDITFTNNKSASTTNVGDYYNPVRMYKKSSITIDFIYSIYMIEFDCNTTEDYATELKNSITDGTVNISGNIVTVLLAEPSKSYTIPALAAQVRLNSLTITYSTVGETAAPTITSDSDNGCNFIGSTNITITNNTEGATIYYTTDGNDPTTTSNIYTEPFEISTHTTIKAIAVLNNVESDIAEAIYTRVAGDPTILIVEGDADSFEEQVIVRIEAVNGANVYYTLNNKTPDASSTLYEKPLTIKANATLNAIAIEEDGEYESTIVSKEFTKATSYEGIGDATLVTDVSDISADDQIAIVANSYNYALSTTQNNNNRGQVAITKEGNSITVNENVQIITLEKGTIENTFALNVGDGYLYAASKSNNHLKTEETMSDNSSWTIEITEGIATVTANGTNTNNWLRYNQTSSLFSCYAATSSQKDISIYKINNIEAYTLTVGEAGWATLFLNYNAKIPADVKCYTASAASSKSVTLTEIADVIPANTAVIVKAKNGNYTFEVSVKANYTESILLGTTANEYIDKEAYVLGMVDGEVGLYKAKMKGGVFLNNANKAYLPMSAIASGASLSSGLRFNFKHDTTTEVEGVLITNKEEEIYDLMGRKVETPSKGIYIINGKKVLVK